MLKLTELKRGFEHLTNEMLENIIGWWMRDPPKFERDLVLPRLLEEKLNRMINAEIYNEREKAATRTR